MKEIKTILILSAIIGLSVLILTDISTASGEDVGIVRDTHYENTIMEFNGNLTIKTGAVLSLENATLRFNVSKNGEYGIKVMSGGGIIANNTVFTDGIYDDDSNSSGNYRYFFIVKEGGSITLTNSTVEECGFKGEATDTEGLYVEGEGSVFFNTTFQRNHHSLILFSTFNVNVDGCTFRLSPAGLYAMGAEDTIVGNCAFTDQTIGAVFLGGGNNTVKGCTFLRNIYGLYLDYKSDNNRFSDLTIQGINRNTTLYGAILINSEHNVFEKIKIVSAGGGIYLLNSNRTVFEGLNIDDTNISLYLNASCENRISNSSLSGGDHLVLETNSTGNVLINTKIKRLRTDDSRLSYREEYSLNIRVRDEAHYPIKGADIRVTDEMQGNNLTVYSTPYSGGSGAPTDASGTIRELILPYRDYTISAGNISYVEHNITIFVHYMDWNDTSTIFLDEKKTVNFTMLRDDVITVAKDESGDYTTIQEAINAAPEGDIVFVNAGEYNDSLTIGKRITLRGEGDKAGIHTLLNGLDGETTVTATASGVVIDTLKVVGGTIGIELDDVSGCALQNLEVKDTEKHGIVFRRVTHSFVNGTEVMGTGQSGLFLYDRSEHNTINSSVFHNAGTNSGGVFISSLSGSSNFNRVVGCEFYFNPIGIIIEDNKQTLVQGCRIHNNNAGIAMNLSSDTIVENCTINRTAYMGIQMVNTEDSLLRNLEMKDDNVAILDTSSKGITLVDTNIADSQSGIMLSGTKESAFSNTSITAQVYGMEMVGEAHDNTLSHLTISNAQAGVGIEGGSEKNFLGNSTLIHCRYGLLFNSGSRNIIRNLTIPDSTEKDIRILGESRDNIFYDTEFDTFSAAQNSTAYFYHFISIRVRNVPGEPLQRIEVKIVSTYGEGRKETIYATPYYGGIDQVTDDNGIIGPVPVRYMEFVNGTLYQGLTATAFLHDSEWEYERGLDLSSTHMEEIIRDLTPTARIISISPNPALKGVDTVSFQGQGSDDVGISAYEWASDRDGILSNQRNFVRSASTLSTGNHTISFRVKDTTGHWSPYVYASLNVMRENTAPYATAVRIEPAVPTGNENLRVLYDFVDPDGDNETGTLFLWYVDDGNGFRATNFTGRVVGKDNLSLGQRWKCQVTPFDGRDYGTPVNSSAVLIKKPVSGTTNTFNSRTALAVFSLLIVGLAGAFLYQAVFKRSPIEEIFLIYQDGRLIAHETRRLKPMDADVISSMLSAVQDFVKDSFSEEKDATLDRLDFGDLSIVLAGGKFVFIAAVVSEEPAGIRKRLQEAVLELEERYRDSLEHWDGTMDSVQDVSQALREIIDSASPAGFVRGIFRGKEERKEDEVKVEDKEPVGGPSKETDIGVWAPPQEKEAEKQVVKEPVSEKEGSVSAETGGKGVETPAEKAADETQEADNRKNKDEKEEENEKKDEEEKGGRKEIANGQWEMGKGEKEEKKKETGGGGGWDDFNVDAQEGKLHFGK